MTREILMASPAAGKAFEMGIPLADVMAREFPHPSLGQSFQELVEQVGETVISWQNRLLEELQNPLPLLMTTLEFFNREEGAQISGNTIEASLMITAFSLLTFGASGCGPEEVTRAGMPLTAEQRSVLENGIPMATREAIVNVGKGDLGNCGEQAMYKYTGGARDPWCTEFVMYCYKKGAPSLFSNLEITDSSEMEKLFRALSLWGKNKIPEPGDYVRFYFGIENGVHLFHGALVERVEKSQDGSYILHVISGNACEDKTKIETCCVKRQEYELDDPDILGFGYLPKATKQTKMASTSGETPIVEPKTGQSIVHVVQAGENLYRIALRYGVTVEALAAANNIADPNKINAGQSLVIPGYSSSSSEPSGQPVAVDTPVPQAPQPEAIPASPASGEIPPAPQPTATRQPTQEQVSTTPDTVEVELKGGCASPTSIKISGNDAEEIGNGRYNYEVFVFDPANPSELSKKVSVQCGDQNGDGQTDCWVDCP